MKSVSYYSFDDNEANGLCTDSRASSDYPYMVNCAGFVTIDVPFTTFNSIGRLDYYLMYISDGRLRAELNGEQVKVGAGDVLIFPPEYKYRYTLPTGSPVSYYFVHFTGSHAESLLAELGFSELPAICRVGYSQNATQGFCDIFDAYLCDDRFRDLSLSAALERVLIALARASHAIESPSPIERSIAYIKASYTEEISIPAIAAMEGLSVSRYNAVFKGVTGISPIKYITDLRMKHACSLLKSTNLHVKEIGSIVGYRDNHFFSKAFKSKMGLSPQKYREK